MILRDLRVGPCVLVVVALTSACSGDKSDESGASATATTTSGEATTDASTSDASAATTDASTTASTTATTSAGTTASTSAGTTASTSAGTTTTTSESTTATTGSMCPAGTCVLRGGSECEAPGGPLGNGCCECGDDGLCSSYCQCADPSSLIATPTGERRIDALAVGDPVYTIADGAVIIAPIAAIHRRPLVDHQVVQVILEDGRELRMSPGHPTADGRLFGGLRAGDHLDGAAIRAAALVPFTAEATHDILPASPTGIYFAAGVAVGSTLWRGELGAAGRAGDLAAAGRCPAE